MNNKDKVELEQTSRLIHISNVINPKTVKLIKNFIQANRNIRLTVTAGKTEKSTGRGRNKTPPSFPYDEVIKSSEWFQEQTKKNGKPLRICSPFNIDFLTITKSGDLSGRVTSTNPFGKALLEGDVPVFKIRYSYDQLTTTDERGREVKKITFIRFWLEMK